MKLRVLLLAVPAALVIVPTTAFAFSEAIARGEIEPEISAAGIDLSGMGRDDALEALRGYESRLRATPLTFQVKDSLFTLSPATVDMEIDEEAIVDQAFSAREQPGLLSRFSDWISSSREYEPIELTVNLTVDDARLEDVFNAWEIAAIPVPPYEGNIIVTAGRIVPDYPRSGEGIDREIATQLTSNAMRTIDRSVVELPTRRIEPELTSDDLNRWVEEANLWIDGPVTLTGTDPDVEITFTRDDLLAALRTELKTNSPASFNVWFDGGVIAALVEPLRPLIEQAPRNAEIVVDEEQKTVTVIPSRDAVLLDVASVVRALTEAATTDSDAGLLPYAAGDQPELTTEMVAAYGPLGLISSFTTEHSCCQDRVDNIQLFAETVDGAVVAPGAEFSLNGHVGERTLAKGYKPAGTLIGGELVDTVGGGVSQFATTFYNAVFYGCFEDVSHKPHSYYFTRYPEVNEATISWPSLDLVFRNDGAAPIILKTQYTGTTITVEFYGNNGGRTCARRLGSRYKFTSPRVEFKGDPLLDPGVEVEDAKGRGGWTNTVTRVMTFPDGHVEEQLWTWVYRAAPQVFLVHPCMLEEAEEECPMVPDVVGQPSATAQAAIAAEGYTVSVVEFETSDEANESVDGTVKSQSPAGGTLMAQGKNVQITVWKYTPPDPDPPPDEGGGEGGD